MIQKPLRGRHFMDKELSDIVFKKAIDILNKNRIKYWIEYGTLLGAIREYDFINIDYDIDISILGNQDLDNVFVDFEKAGIGLGKSYIEIGGKKLIRKANRHIIGEGNKFTKIELFTVYKVGDCYYSLKGKDEKGLLGIRTPKEYVEKLSVMYFKERFVWIPTEVEKYLKFLYGDWTIQRQDIPEGYKKPYEQINTEDLLKELSEEYEG